MEPRTIFFIGKPGSGKGDQTKLLSKHTGWNIISSGEQFRAMITEESPLGRKAKEVNDAGLLQPHWLATYLFLKNVLSLREEEGVIFDGFSRKPPEAELAVEVLTWLGRPFMALHLKVSDKEIIYRLELRKSIEGRADDNAIEKRLKEYREFTEPCIEMFRAKGLLLEVNGEGDREAIAADIRKALGLSAQVGTS